MKEIYYPYGVIGKSGTFYACEYGEHVSTMLDYKEDGPFAECKRNYIAFDNWYTVARGIPTRQQFETAMDWCTSQGLKFECVIDGHDGPWQSYRA